MKAQKCTSQGNLALPVPGQQIAPHPLVDGAPAVVRPSELPSNRAGGVCVTEMVHTLLDALAERLGVVEAVQGQGLHHLFAIDVSIW